MGYAEIKNGKLTMRFPEIGEDCELRIAFHRTLRIPDDNREYPLPPSLGLFGLEHVDDHKGKIPESWAEHGGILLPMWQAEAMWLSFESPSGRPFAVKVAAGKINALSGKSWSNGLEGGDRSRQDYLVAPEQPWIDGFCVAEGKVRQFVAMPLGKGYTAEEQLTGKAEFGGLQIIAYPMSQARWDLIRIERERSEQGRWRGKCASPSPWGYGDGAVYACASSASPLRSASLQAAEMGMAPGGAMRQSIAKDRYGIEAWDQNASARCYAHILNAEQSWAVLGKAPAGTPPSAADYARRGLPWFEHYALGDKLPGSEELSDLHSVAALGIKKGEKPLPDDEPAQVAPGSVIPTGPWAGKCKILPPGAARDGKW